MFNRRIVQGVVGCLALVGMLVCGNRAQAQNTTFPYNATYPNGLNGVSSNQTSTNNEIQADWDRFKASWITTSGAGANAKRVLFGQDSVNGTVSEGQAYGMLYAVYFNDQTLFNQLYQYVKTHRNSRGMMWWHIDGNGNYTTNDGGSSGATDADEDIAVALCFAHKRWGSGGSVNYQQEAITTINNLMEYCVDDDGGLEGSNPTYTLLPGDWQTFGPITFNPSYFAPSWYRIFKAMTGDSRWDNVISRGYYLMGISQNSSTGLFPGDCNTSGQPINGGNNYRWEYNAFRVPWRLGLDWSWYGNTTGRDQTRKIADFYLGVANTNGIGNLKADRQLNGTVQGNYENSCFAGAAASAMLSRDSVSNARNFLNNLQNRDDNGYYVQAWELWHLMYISGNLPNLWTMNFGGTPPPPAVTIYEDALASDWANWSWSTTVNLNNASPVKNGSTSISATYTAGWAALSLRKGTALSTSGKTKITFWVHGGSGSNKSLKLYTQTADSGGDSGPYTFTATAGTWTQITVNLSAIGNPASIKRLNIQNNSGSSQSVIYVDSIKLE